MAMNQTAAVYTDFSGLAALRQQARANPEQSLEKVAGQFESIFLQMMMKSMRDATVDGGLFDSEQLDLYQSMFDQQVALELSSTRTESSRKSVLGLQDLIVKQLSPSSPAQQTDINPFLRPKVVPLVEMSAVPAKDWQPETPEAFIHGVWSHATDAAAELGVAPGVLVAQAALETGWGQRMIRRADGANSFNLFGIKAAGGWSGATARVGTVEYLDGVAQREFADFRAYASLAESFADYVTFLQESPRYQQALTKASDSHGFLTELQAAGYATDPKYAQKILSILEGEHFRELKGFTQMPLFSRAGL